MVHVDSLSMDNNISNSAFPWWIARAVVGEHQFPPTHPIGDLP